MDFELNIEKFNEPIIKKKNFSVSNHKIFKKYSSELYQKYTFELLETLCNKSHFEHKTKILYNSIYFLLKFLYKSKNDIFIENYDLIILTSFYIGIKVVENQKKIPKLIKLKNIYPQKFGDYSNIEIKESELIYLELLDYKINFMTIYDYLIYIFQNNTEKILLYQKSINKMLKHNTVYFSTLSPFELIQEVTNNSEINKMTKYPGIIQKKIIFKSRENSFGLEIGSNIDESLSTSISSVHQNNYNKHYNEPNNNSINYKNMECESSFNNYQKRTLKPNFTRPNKIIYNSNLMNSSANIICYNSLTINPNESIDYEKSENNFIYSRKNIKDLKSVTSKKEAYIHKNAYVYKTNTKEKIFRNNNSTYNINLSKKINSKFFYTNDKNVYIKPNIKKEESQSYFTSVKKRELPSKYMSFKKLNNLIEEDYYDDYKENLKKKLFF